MSSSEGSRLTQFIVEFHFDVALYLLQVRYCNLSIVDVKYTV